ncbi:hypothetical protein G7Y89_g3709 [Cudoniella acicularis]|uniref:Uncharacterized protein n=1 Tax=Cudoniella acicularis TaxID=354080 RepID=A0A8H4RRP4_9HELO|nr:hypothetical protein G7Y89_g3709 [Cudoniella acicularis]
MFYIHQSKIFVPTSQINSCRTFGFSETLYSIEITNPDTCIGVRGSDFRKSDYSAAANCKLDRLIWFAEEANVVTWTIASISVIAGLCGVQGVTAFYVMLHAIFPSIANVPNPFGPEVTMAGGRLIGFVIAWLCTLSSTYFKTHRFKKLIIVKAAIMLTCLIAFFGWSIHLANGVGPVILQGSNIPAGKSKGWVFVSQAMIMAANEVTFSLNASDVSRYAMKPNDPLWPPLFYHPLATTIVSFFGIFVTSSSSVILGELLWDPNSILDGFFLLDYNPKTRAAVFFIALGFGFAQITSNVLANLISTRNDTSALFPRFVNIRRGVVIILVLSFAINPS